MKSNHWVLAAVALAFIGTIHAAEPPREFPPRSSQGAPKLLGNGCSINDSTGRAHQAMTSEQRTAMSRAQVELDGLARQFARDRQSASSVAAPMEITVPVVVHVVHDNGAENISDARIIAAIDQMTQDFHAYPFAGSVDGYGNLQANVGFSFRLAKLDPLGRPKIGRAHV